MLKESVRRGAAYLVSQLLRLRERGPTDDNPADEVSGTTRQFTCKYHARRYGLDGACTFVQQEGEFFSLDKSQLGLVPVRCEVWEGFIFINLDRNGTTPLRDYLGRLAGGLEGYPFGELTEVYKYNVAVLDLNPADTGLGLIADITSQAQVDAALAAIREQLGPVTICVNAAGKEGYKRFHDLTFERWEQLISINLHGVFRMTQAVLPDMLSAGWGRIVNISSSSRPEDIAAACSFLVSEEASYITGQILGVNGGRNT
jgi:hypothetical protein